MLKTLWLLSLSFGLLLGQKAKYKPYYDSQSDQFPSSITVGPDYSVSIKQPRHVPEQKSRFRGTESMGQQASLPASSVQGDDKDTKSVAYVDEEIPHTFTVKHDISDRLAKLLFEPHVTITKRVWSPRPASPLAGVATGFGGGKGGWATETHHTTETHTFTITKTTEKTSIVYSTSFVTVGIPLPIQVQQAQRPVESVPSANNAQLLTDLLSMLSSLTGSAPQRSMLTNRPLSPGSIPSAMNGMPNLNSTMNGMPSLNGTMNGMPSLNNSLGSPPNYPTPLGGMPNPLYGPAINSNPLIVQPNSTIINNPPNSDESPVLSRSPLISQSPNRLLPL